MGLVWRCGVNNININDEVFGAISKSIAIGIIIGGTILIGIYNVIEYAKGF